MAGKTRVGPLSSGLAKIVFGEQPKPKMNPLDEAISKGKKLPSKNKRPERFLDK